MYMQHTREQLLAFAELSDDYRVAGVLACGTWDLSVEGKQLPHLRAALNATVGSGNYVISKLAASMIGHAYEVQVGGSIYWFVPVMGAAMMGQYLHMASLFGSKLNILLGTCGGLNPGLQTGDMIIPVEVAGNDNARVYARDNHENLYRPDEDLTRMLAGNLGTGQRVIFDRTVTCEMIFGETDADVRGWIEAGYAGVEMEAAVTYAISAHFGVPATALLVVDDNLVADETLISQEAAGAAERERVKAQQYVAGVRTLLSGDMLAERS